MVSQLNSSGISSQDSPRCSSAKKSSIYCLRLGEDHLHVDVQRHPRDQRTTRKNANQMLNSFLYLQKDSEKDNGHSSDLDQKKSGILSVKIVHKVNGTKWRKT